MRKVEYVLSDGTVTTSYAKAQSQAHKVVLTPIVDKVREPITPIRKDMLETYGRVTADLMKYYI